MYRSTDDLQADLDAWIKDYKERSGCNADDEGENDRGLTATDTKTRTRHQLSDRVPANTLEQPDAHRTNNDKNPEAPAVKREAEEDCRR